MNFKFKMKTYYWWGIEGRCRSSTTVKEKRDWKKVYCILHRKRHLQFAVAEQSEKAVFV